MSGGRRLGLFEGYGVEIEYMIVDCRTLRVRPIADALFAAAVGRPAAEFEHAGMGWSNELTAHLMELKNWSPAPALDGLEAGFDREVARANGLLAAHGARLLPTGMHPFMDPRSELRLWPHERREIYAAYDRIFDCRAHGWANLQATHLNLSFDGDDDFGRLHAAIRILLPILPALAASSPIVDGRRSGFHCTRMEAYRHNAARVPSIAGRIVPEPVFSAGAYRAEVLDRMYRDIAAFDPEGILRDEWLNSRGVIPRFDRGAFEIRVLDVQECPAADLAVARAVVGALKALVGERWSSEAAQKGWPTERLERILLATVRDGEHARIDDTEYTRHLGWDGEAVPSAGRIWRRLVERCAGEMVSRPLAVILEEGTLSSRILRAAGADPSGDRIRSVYLRLADCLAEGRMFCNL